MEKRRAVISAMKNEGPYIVEWVAWNRLVGFSDIIIGANDCEDGSDRLLACLAHHGVIRYIENTVPEGQGPQHAFYRKVQKLDIYPGIEWLAVIDADEFINLNIGEGGIGDLALAYPQVDIVQLNWAVFGNDGATGFVDVPVTERFTRRMPDRHRINAGCKSITRLPQRFARLHNHNPGDYRGEAALTVLGGSGVLRQIAADEKLTPALQYTDAVDVSFEIGQINHYAIKSRDEYQLRQQRGRGILPAAAAQKLRHDEKYFALRSAASVTDLSLQRRRAELCGGISALLALPGMREAHEASTTWHREKIAALSRQI